MNKNIKLSVSSFLLAGFFLTSCSQQQINAGSQSAGGQQVYGGSSESSSDGSGNPILDGYGSPVKDGHGGTVNHTYGASSNAGSSSIDSQHIDSQHAPLVNSVAADAQIQEVVVPAEPVYQAPRAKPRPKPVQRPRVMHKPVQRMAKPVQRHSVAYTDKRSGMPPAKPGQCYAKVRTGPTFRNAVKRVQVSPAVNKRVLVRGPQYSYTSRRVQVRPATHSYRFVPAQYRNTSKRVLVKPAHYAWQKGKKGPVTRIDNMTGEILCRVKIPAVYRTVVRKVLVRPAQRIKRNIPAVYRTVKQKKLASPAQYRNVRTPARFVNKTYRIKSGNGGYKWQPINC